MADLSTRRRAFIEFYLQTGNASKAAVQAGYSRRSSRSTSTRLMQHPAIRAEIERRRGPLQKETDRTYAHLQVGARAGYVYVLRADNGLVKIGKTVEIADRMRVLNTMLPYDLEVVYVFRSQDRGQLERTLHNHFASQRIRGEWFRLSAEQITSMPSVGSAWLD